MTQAIHVPGLADIATGDDVQLYAAQPPGAYDIETDADGQRRLWFKCPGACKHITPINLRPARPKWGQQPSWELVQEQPLTLQPSINHVGCWHGWLSAGVFTSC